MRHRVGVPTLSEHRDRDNASNRLAESPLLSYGIHYLPQDVFIADGVNIETTIAPTHIVLEGLNFMSCSLSEVALHAFT